MMPLNALVLVVHQCPVSQCGACPLSQPKVPCPPSLVAIIKYHQRLAKQTMPNASVPFEIETYPLSSSGSGLPLSLVGSL